MKSLMNKIKMMILNCLRLFTRSPRDISRLCSSIPTAGEFWEMLKNNFLLVDGKCVRIPDIRRIGIYAYFGVRSL